MPIVSLDDPAGITNELLGSLKPLVDDVQQGLHAYTRIKNLDHLLDANPGMLAHLGKSFDGSCQYRMLHTSPPHTQEIRTPWKGRL
jgi:hypothetical protein